MKYSLEFNGVQHTYTHIHTHTHTYTHIHTHTHTHLGPMVYSRAAPATRTPPFTSITRNHSEPV
jgi:hypothetical protein